MRHVAIIGGGIAGPATALALRKAGIDATVYEAYPTPADGIGGTLALAPNGMAALEIIGTADAVKSVAQPSSRMVMTVASRKRMELPVLSDAGPLFVVRRADLYRTLHDEAVRQGITIEYGKRLVGVEHTTAVFDDGSRAGFDVLVGADGIHSTVRRLIDPNAPGPKWTGMLGLEGYRLTRCRKTRRRWSSPTAGAATTSTGRRRAAAPPGARTCPTTGP